MIDSHVHLNLRDYEDDFDAVLSRAREAGVTRMMNISFDLPSSRETVALVGKLRGLFGAVGTHPHDAKTYGDREEEALAELLDAPRVIAVGEIGLDYYRDLSPRECQREVFKRQLLLARGKNKPIVIHCRDAFDDVIRVLHEQGTRYQGIFHAFAGDFAMAEEVLALGFHIGIGGVVTFKNSLLADVVPRLPFESIVLETDCPYLAPVPFRGKRNEPAYLAYIAEKIAAVRGVDIHEVDRMTTANFLNAMGIEISHESH